MDIPTSTVSEEKIKNSNGHDHSVRQKILTQDKVDHEGLSELHLEGDGSARSRSGSKEEGAPHDGPKKTRVHHLHKLERSVN